MGNSTEQTSPAASNKRNGILAIVSVILGVLGFVLPCLAFLTLGFLLNDYLIGAIGLQNFNLLNVYVPIALWIAGPIAIIVGILSLPKRAAGGIPEVTSKSAKAGIVLGVLTIPCVLLPLLLWLLMVKGCANGC